MGVRGTRSSLCLGQWGRETAHCVLGFATLSRPRLLTFHPALSTRNKRLPLKESLCLRSNKTLLGQRPGLHLRLGAAVPGGTALALGVQGVHLCMMHRSVKRRMLTLLRIVVDSLRLSRLRASPLAFRFARNASSKKVSKTLISEPHVFLTHPTRPSSGFGSGSAGSADWLRFSSQRRQPRRQRAALK